MRFPVAGLVVVAFAAACSSGGGKADGSATADAGPIVDAPEDVSSDDAGDAANGDAEDAAAVDDAPVLDAADEGPADASSPLVSFVFTNSTGHTIYIQLFGFSTQEYWSLVEGGNHLPVDNSCELCDCSRCPACAVCGRGIARVEALAPGAQHRWTWDTRIWEMVPAGCRADLACEQDRGIPAGAALEATVTYSASFAVNTSFGADDELIGPALTATVAFTNAPGASVEITATQ
jgi:hypothetical protein